VAGTLVREVMARHAAQLVIDKHDRLIKGRPIPSATLAQKLGQIALVPGHSSHILPLGRGGSKGQQSWQDRMVAGLRRRRQVRHSLIDLDVQIGTLAGSGLK
jgi:hypothetical protein